MAPWNLKKSTHPVRYAALCTLLFPRHTTGLVNQLPLLHRKRENVTTVSILHQSSVHLVRIFSNGIHTFRHHLYKIQKLTHVRKKFVPPSAHTFCLAVLLSIYFRMKAWKWFVSVLITNTHIDTSFLYGQNFSLSTSAFFAMATLKKEQKIKTE
jgi:hypothetical protein